MSAGRGRLSWPAPAAAAGRTAGLPADKRGARSPSSRWPLSASIRRAACTTSGLGSASAALLNGRDRAVSQRPRPVPRQGIRSGIAGHARPQGRRPRQGPAARSRAPLKRQQAVVRTRPAITQPGEKRPVTLRQQYPVLLLEPGRRSFRQGRAQHETMAMGAEAFQPPAASFAKLDANPANRLANLLSSIGRSRHNPSVISEPGRGGTPHNRQPARKPWGPQARADHPDLHQSRASLSRPVSRS